MSGAPPEAVAARPEAAWLYRGPVMHQRMRPFSHRFTYQVWSLLIDIDRIDEAVAAGGRMMARNRFAPISFHDRDHGPDDGSPLRAHLDKLLAGAGAPPAERVFLLCYPRVLGHTFNPIAVYYCHDAEGRLATLVYEVRNTFGEKHTYVVPVAEDERGPAGVRQTREKRFFVSPFLGFGLTYRFRLNAPGEELRLRIMEVDAETAAPVLAATFAGERMALTPANLKALFWSVPLLGLKVVGGIHWEALKIWLKGARLVPRPKRPPPASVGEPPRYFDPAAPLGAYDGKMTPRS